MIIGSEAIKIMNINVSKVKIVTTLPEENADEIILAFGEVGAGVIGNYTHCSTSVNCVGTFKGNEESNPYIGVKNQLEKVDEVKLEVLCEIGRVKLALHKLRELHPYEEPAVDLIPLIDENIL